MDRRHFLASTACFAGVAATPGIAQNLPVQKFASATLGDVQHHFQQEYAEQMNQAGVLTVELYPASQLGPIPSMVNGVMLGSIETFITATAFLSQVDPRFQVFDVAALLSDPVKTRALFASDQACARIEGYGDGRNVLPLSTFVHSPNAIISKSPIETIDDLAGLKIRVLGSPFQIEPMRAVGATPVPMPLSEVMPALQTGAIDAVVSSPTVATAFRYHDAAAHMVIIDSWPLVVTMANSRSWFDALPEATQSTLRTTVRAVEQDAVAWGAADVERARTAWADAGGSLHATDPTFEAELQTAIAESTAPLIAGSPALAGEVAAMESIAASIS
ncbi:TRAP transporter substrate-binding protein [uncultured Roseobacter sp.]|uniref:TRAP transporter substrate-binding protein n=1 Tax=uncultured Roseobacter sp. TaxID=114847 RepID=UPI00262B882D|nr:TRAP transporter substrate-binding protein [uncultured Roseobacter sp.]